MDLWKVTVWTYSYFALNLTFFHSVQLEQPFHNLVNTFPIAFKFSCYSPVFFLGGKLVAKSIYSFNQYFFF